MSSLNKRRISVRQNGVCAHDTLTTRWVILIGWQFQTHAHTHNLAFCCRKLFATYSLQVAGQNVFQCDCLRLRTENGNRSGWKEAAEKLWAKELIGLSCRKCVGDFVLRSLFFARLCSKSLGGDDWFWQRIDFFDSTNFILTNPNAMLQFITGNLIFCFHFFELLLKSNTAGDQVRWWMNAKRESDRLFLKKLKSN